MDVEEIEREIEELPKFDRSILITQVLFDLCRELLGEDACRDQLKELFGIDYLEKLEKRFETNVWAR